MPVIMYKLTKGGKTFQIWSAWTEGADVVTKYGKLGGKMQESRYTAEAKNIGKVNEYTPEEQAGIELVALYVDRSNNQHYRESEDGARLVYNACVVPMKLANFKDSEAHIKYPCYVQRKFNGSRLMMLDGVAISKIGRVESFGIEHLREQVAQLGINIDAEVYTHGLSLQKIRSATTKANQDTPALTLVIFDAPLRDVVFSDRLRDLRRIQRRIKELSLTHLSVEMPTLVNNREELMAFYEGVIPEYEGIVIRNQDSLFEFGVRSSSTQKLKPRYDGEALVTGVEECKNGDGKLILRASDSLDGVIFKCMMKVLRRDGLSHPRKVTDMEPLIGQWITFSYEELSDAGIPTKPVGETPRLCNEKGEPLE